MKMHTIKLDKHNRVCGGYVPGKICNSDRHCFLNSEHKNVEFFTTITTLLRQLSTHCLKPKILIRHNSLKLNMMNDIVGTVHLYFV